MFKLVHPEFLPLLNLLERETDMSVYRFIENLILCDTDDTLRIKKSIDANGLEGGLSEIKTICSERFFSDEGKLLNRRKVVKDEMIENYVIRKKLGAETLRRINVKMCLKRICQKNIIFKNGEIVDIIIT